MSLIQAKFLYGLSLWGKHISDFEKVKKISSRFFSPILKKLGILKVSDLYEVINHTLVCYLLQKI